MTEALRILLVDDSPDDREAIARILSALPSRAVEVVEAECGDSALDRLRETGLDCVLLDFSMPGHDGLAVLSEIRLRYTDMPIVMMTGEGNERVAVTALKT